MRNYARVLTSIWVDEDFKALSAGAQWLYLLLLSQPDLTAAGAISYSPRRWASYSPSVTLAQVDQAFAELLEQRFLLADQATEEVLIRTFIRHDSLLSNTKMLRAATHASTLLQSAVLREHATTELVRLRDRRAGRREEHPYPYPQPHPHQGPSAAELLEDATSVAPDDDDDEGDQDEGERSVVHKAVDILAARDVADHYGRGGKVTSSAAFEAACWTRRWTEHEAALRDLAQRHPEWPAAKLAGAVSHPAAPAPDEYAPEGTFTEPKPDFDAIRRAAGRPLRLVEEEDQ